MNATSVSTHFFSQLTQKRQFAAHIADLAVSLAAEAGEAAPRPLSQAQLARALQTNYAETEIVMDLVLAWASDMKRDGKLSDDDVFFD